MEAIYQLRQMHVGNKLHVHVDKKKKDSQYLKKIVLAVGYYLLLIYYHNHFLMYQLPKFCK